ncbi:type II toxin-antitoxin system RelE/ParE family toxin [Candidatus Pacearchaeota archaeon]|nr:type II toxin-antitoxin system RelE/ParE family toxin [Candidatus Pacearchaeota archaeon]
MYEIEWKEHALKNLEKLEVSITRRIVKKVEEMRENLYLCDVKKLKGYDKHYRLRIGDFRVIFELIDNSLTILKVGHRQNIYE